MRIRVSVPASAGNTGSAFDSLGIAYGLSNEVIVDTEAPGRLDVEGEGADLLKKGEPNLVQQAMERFVQATGKKLPPAGLTLVNRIPFGRGLGSSAAAIVGGLVAADALAETGLSRLKLLQLALPMEGHPDNVAPALYGGAVLTVLDEGRVDGPLTVVPFTAPSDWRAVLYVPDLIIPTKQARAILPKEVPRADAVFNHSRVGLLVAALTQHRPDLLRVAMQDRLHQPYRAKLMPEMEALIAAGLEAGAWGSCLSGAGSAILAISSKAKADEVSAALTRKAQALKLAGRSLILEIPSSGAKVLPA
ncbi:MAG TPA: homoserine kinase [Planctomycetota bacterium]|nr:homoserine kinase [Planctomycetota bacterium]